ncbi:hypothetical protein K883_02551 [Mycobacterium sp. TKK-01-0059]|nr:hypothetical protein X425_01431 [Mycobacterium avium XTB13-223]KEF97775.1 hypothetical protein K883_02551 [Mycobacterium sp. TKK-01-0059]
MSPNCPRPALALCVRACDVLGSRQPAGLGNPWPGDRCPDQPSGPTCWCCNITPKCGGGTHSPNDERNGDHADHRNEPHGADRQQVREVKEVDAGVGIWNRIRIARYYGVVRTHADTRSPAEDPALPVSAVIPEARNDHAMRPDSLERSTYGNMYSSSKITGVKGIPAVFGGHTGCLGVANLTVRVRARLLAVGSPSRTSTCHNGAPDSRSVAWTLLSFVDRS